MTEAIADRARWASAFADELAGFEPGPYVPEDEGAGMPLSPATRLSVSQENARKRAKRARDKARKVHELDAAVAQGLRSILRQRLVYERMKDGEPLDRMAVRIEPVLAEAMRYLVEICGWDRKLASRALTVKLLRPAQPPAAKA